MNKRVTVLVTGVGGRSVGHQILQALLLCGDKYRVIATDAERFSYGLYQVANRYVVPRAHSPAYLPALRRLVERESVDIILPGTQPEVGILSAAELPCPVLANPASVVKLCSSKEVLYDWLRAHDFGVPASVSGREWQRLVSQHGFPVVAKPTEDSGGSKAVAILNSEQEVRDYLQEMPAEQTVFQEYVGNGETEYTVGVMVSQKGRVIDSIVLHRNLVGITRGLTRRISGREYVLSTGYSQGFIVRHPVIQRVCEDLAVQIGIRGPCNIQLRLAGNRVVVFEVHPRFSGTTSIRAAVGYNEPDVLIQNWLFGVEPASVSYQTDVAAIRAFSHLIVPLADLNAVPEA